MDTRARIMACTSPEQLESELADVCNSDRLGRMLQGSAPQSDVPALKDAARQAIERENWPLLEYIASHLEQFTSQVEDPAGETTGGGEGGAAAEPDVGHSLDAVMAGCVGVIDSQLEALGASYPCIVQKCPACSLGPAGSGELGVDIGAVQFLVAAAGCGDEAFRLTLRPYLASAAATQAAARTQLTRVVDSGRTAAHRGKNLKVYSFLLKPKLASEQSGASKQAVHSSF